LPTPLNLPFQCSAGSQTSSLMSESGVVASVAVTRQNAGADWKMGGTASPAFKFGGVNLPAATLSAVVMVTSGNFSWRKPAQEPTGESAAEAKPEKINRTGNSRDKRLDM